MKRWIPLLYLLFAFPVSAQNQPAVSVGHQQLPITYEACLTRARQALELEGFAAARGGGNFYWGGKGIHHATIVCDPGADNRIDVHVFVASTSGDGNVPGAERVRLLQRMENPQTGGSGPKACAPFEGTWSSQSGGWNGPITFRRSGNQVTGTYELQGSACSISGILSGDVLEGEYSQPSYADPRYRRGRIRFVLSGDRQSYAGQWWDANGAAGGTWNGQCQSPSSGSGSGGVVSGTSGGATNDCAPFEGAWASQSGAWSGPIIFRRSGNQVTGSYELQGSACTVSGILSGDVLEGEYSQPSYPNPRYLRGRIRFVLAGDRRSFTGQWWDANGAPGGTWNGQCQSPSTRGEAGRATRSTNAICDNPQTISMMDEWLRGANPVENQSPGYNLRYEPWGRLIGTSPSANLTAPNPPDTDLTRCEWLWKQAANLRSTNLGTLKEYIERRLR